MALLACKATERPHVVFVTIDTLRADHLSGYGYPRPTSPFLDELAGQGTRFEAAFSTSSHTTPSHASMFLSRHPIQHGLLTNEHVPGPNPESLPARLAAAGYTTAAFPGARFLESFAAWFDHLEAADQRVVPAAQVVDSTLAWLDDGAPSGPVFLWVHFYDVHEWVRPKVVPPGEVHFQSVRQGLDSAGAVAWAERRHGAEAGIFERARAVRPDVLPLDEYDARIHAVDAELRRLHAGFAARARDRDTLWVVTSDHGEGLGGHGWMSHGRYVYHEQIRVPLILARTPTEHAPIPVVETPVSAVDLLPTLLDLVDAPVEPQFAPVGRSLVPLLRGEALPPRLLYAERRPWDGHAVRKDWVRGEVYTVFDAERKYIRREQAEDEYFELDTDPLERHNKPGSAEAGAMAERARGVREALEARLGGGASLDLSPERVEDLRALGYL